MYIANYADDGYIVISADDRHEPICALVEQGKYEVAEVPSMLLEWFYITFENILLVRSGAINSSHFADGGMGKGNQKYWGRRIFGYRRLLS